ncbi:putative autoinducer synthesis protein [Ruegeria denitrificans]|uniref:acyl-homoserine-lactone synthase n=1 Tax=Ruegeria denitrificans TaxID=1715692 RepID=A0A0P1I5G0_9RHOB|nr:acyl-homoserine-lactone synthase [Ruegeria denitrificans]CUJ90944.1 putative autoinducer synthesis protein [Ruegeria denitrificans]
MDRPLSYRRAYQAAEAFPDLSPANDAPTAPKSLARRKLFTVKRAEPEPRGAFGDVRSTTMSFRNMHEHGTLLTKYLEMRKAIFIDKLKWQVGEADRMEFDQYDTPACQWIVLHEFGEVLGGVRLLPSTAQCGIYSYMLRDAQRGILKGMPTDILFFDAPVKQGVWEATRFFVSDSVSSSRRLLVQQELFHQMTLAAEQSGALSILGIVPALWARWSRRLGVSASPVGAKFSIDGTASQSVLFNIDR